MSNDYGLSVAVEATVAKFQQQMDEIGSYADAAANKIEEKFNAINPTFAGSGALAIGGGIAGAWGLEAAYELLQKMNAALAEMGENARRVGMSTDQFQSVSFATAIGGASNADTVTSLTKMSDLLGDASRNENTLSKLLDANNIKYENANGSLISTNQLLTIAADLIQRAQTPQAESAIAKMFGISQSLVPSLRQGGEAFNSIVDGANAAGAVIDAETIAKAKQFDDEWRKSSVEWSAYMKSMLADILPYMDDLIGKAKEFLKSVTDGSLLSSAASKMQAASIVAQSSVSGVDNYIASATQSELETIKRIVESKGEEVNPAVTQRLNQLQNTQSAAPAAAPVYNVGDDPTAGIDVSRFSNPSTVAGKGSDTKDAFDRQSASIVKQTAVLQAHSLAVGQDTGQQQQAKAAAELLTAAQSTSRTINTDLTDKIKSLSQSYGDAALAAALATQKFQQQNELLQFGGNEMISILDGIRTKSLTGAQAVAQLSNTLITAIEKAVLLGSGPLAGIFGSAAAPGSGGTGGLFGSLFGLSGARAGGGSVSSGGMYLVGEEGPEIVRMGADGMVIPNKALSAQSSGDGAGPPIIIQADFRGAAPEAVAAITTQLRQLQTVVGQIPQIVAGTATIRPNLGRN